MSKTKQKSKLAKEKEVIAEALEIPISRVTSKTITYFRKNILLPIHKKSWERKYGKLSVRKRKTYRSKTK